MVDAVNSALGQSWTNLEVIISVDGDRRLLDGMPLPEDSRLRIVASGAHAGAQVARNRGIAESSGAFIALLDDDDEWFPTKIEKQLEIAVEHIERGAQHVLIGCRFLALTPSGQVVRVVPRRLPSPGESISEYLFVRHQIRPGQTELSEGMVLFDRGLADLAPPDLGLSIHYDWDWFLAVERLAAITVDFSPETLLEIRQNPPGFSESSSAKGSTSADWFVKQSENLSARAFGDAILCHSVPLALQRRNWKEVGRLLLLSRGRGSPGLPALIFALLMCFKSLVPKRARLVLERRLTKQGTPS